MAHECPTCSQVCHCNGDVDDLCLNNERDLAICTCCDEDDPDEWEDDDEWNE